MRRRAASHPRKESSSEASKLFRRVHGEGISADDMVAVRLIFPVEDAQIALGSIQAGQHHMEEAISG